MRFELGEERAEETHTAVHCTPKPNEDDDGTNSKENLQKLHDET